MVENFTGKKSLLFTLLICFLVFLNSCSCDCECVRDAGCRTIVASLPGDSVIALRKFCTSNNLDTDQAVKDSIAAFKLKYEKETVRIYSSDSLTMRNYGKKVKCNESDAYVNTGYHCECAE